MQHHLQQNTSQKLFKVTDVSRMRNAFITATSLKNLIEKYLISLELPLTDQYTAVLEPDGTEIDEEYFATLESNIGIMVLNSHQIWLPLAPPYDFNIDVAEAAKIENEIADLIAKLRNNISLLSLLRETELETLSDMDPDSLEDLTFFDRKFLGQIKEASGKFLRDKRQGGDALNLLGLYENELEYSQMF